MSVSQNTEYFDTNTERYWGISKNSWGGLIGGGVLKFSNKISDNLNISFKNIHKQYTDYKTHHVAQKSKTKSRK